jgi:predicted esterase
MAQEHHIAVTRSARYWTLGEMSTATEELWFVLHGYGQLAEYFIRNFQCLDNGKRLIVAPEGLSRFYLKEFTGRVGATWMTREDRETEIRDYVAYLDALHKRVLGAFPAETQERLQVKVLGFSQGVTTACRWLLLGDTEADRLLCWAGGLPADIDIGRYYKGLLESLRPVFIAGTTDEFITPESLAQQRALIEAAGLAYRLVSFEGGHHLDERVLMSLAEEQHD